MYFHSQVAGLFSLIWIKFELNLTIIGNILLISWIIYALIGRWIISWESFHESWPLLASCYSDKSEESDPYALKVGMLI